MGFLGFLWIVVSIHGLWAAESVVWPDYIVRGANISSRATEEDIAHFARQWHGSAVRILVNSITASKPPYAVDEKEKARLFHCLDLCLKYNLLTVVSPSAPSKTTTSSSATRNG